MKSVSEYDEVETMLTPPRTETVAFKQCHNCTAELLARDRFCRHCGIVQTGSSVTAAITADLTSFETRPLRESEKLSPGFSGRLINIVAQTILSQTVLSYASRRVTNLIAVLATVPIWLLIVLMSPLEAYAAARSITKQL